MHTASGIISNGSTLNTFRLLRAIEGEIDNLPYLAFECGDETLEEWMTNDGHSQLDRLKVAFKVCLKIDNGSSLYLSLYSQLCQLLKTLHSEGVVHGDLMPSNVHHFSAMDHWKLLETDRASVSDEPKPIYYTIEYTAPEMLDAAEKNGESVILTPKYDIFSLGIILYEILSGLSPTASHELQWLANYVQQEEGSIRRHLEEETFAFVCDKDTFFQT